MWIGPSLKLSLCSQSERAKMWKFRNRLAWGREIVNWPCHGLRRKGAETLSTSVMAHGACVGEGCMGP